MLVLKRCNVRTKKEIYLYIMRQCTDLPLCYDPYSKHSLRLAPKLIRETAFLYTFSVLVATTLLRFPQKISRQSFEPIQMLFFKEIDSGAHRCTWQQAYRIRSGKYCKRSLNTHQMLSFTKTKHATYPFNVPNGVAIA